MTLGEPKEMSSLWGPLFRLPYAPIRCLCKQSSWLGKERRLSTNQQAESTTVRGAQHAGRDAQDAPSSSKPRHNWTIRDLQQVKETQDYKGKKAEDSSRNLKYVQKTDWQGERKNH